MAIDKHALIARVKELEGLTNDEKSQIIGFIKTKTYGLVWEDSTEKCWEQLKEYIPVLLENKERAIISDKPEATNHILIEGDNLLALTNLCATHQGKIDVIYIDPPYNTGNKDFVYNDSYVDSEDAFRHSKWLSFMSKRLRIAKRLLSDRGVIFISIDDNEQAQLKILCDEIFGDNNFVGQLILKTATDNNPSQINIEHEYMLCFAKNKSFQNNWQRTSQAAKRIIEKYRELNDSGLSVDQIQVELRKWIKANKKDLPQVAHYNNVDDKGVYSSSSNSSNPHPGGYMYDIIHPITHLPCPKPANGWRWPFVTFDEYNRNGEIEWGKDHTTQPHVKKRIETSTEYLRTLIYEDNRGTTKALSDIFDGKKVFDNPKPHNVLSRIIDFSSLCNSTILDFFAGSGTTMHAVMQLNKEDGGHRQCILVTNNENSICENVTYERNKRVINGYTKPNGEWVEGLHDNNLRYYKVGFVPRDKDLRFVTSFAISSVNTLCIKHGVYAEQPQFGSLQCEAKRLRYFDDGVRRFLVILDPELVGDIIAQLQQAEYDGRMPVYVFTTGSYPYTDDFGQVSDRVELFPYPTCIYGACEQVMPRTVDKPLDMPDDIELSDDEANMTYDDLNKE